MKNKNLAIKKGFTLIELLIVITIIGILAVAIVPQLSKSTGRARDVARQSSISSIATAFELYYADNGHYPDGSNACTTALSSTMGSYFDNGLPTDPGGGTGLSGCTDFNYDVSNSTSGNNTQPNAFALCAKVEVAKPGASNYYDAVNATGNSKGEYYCIKKGN